MFMSRRCNFSNYSHYKSRYYFALLYYPLPLSYESLVPCKKFLHVYRNGRFLATLRSTSFLKHINSSYGFQKCLAFGMKQRVLTSTGIHGVAYVKSKKKTEKNGSFMNFGQFDHVIHRTLIIVGVNGNNLV